jgi:Putative Flp pilus-assembly TadE/G-like
MSQRKLSSRRKQERGQTIVLVAISLVSLLAMAALAIDVVTLYAARSETQRAADAAALAAAKAVADSGFTTLPTGDPNYAAAQILAQTMATNAINAILTANPLINQVSGTTPALVGTPTITSSSIPANSNPQITVTLQVTTLPTFFARIWGNQTATVTASSTAEAYNPANVQNFTPIAPKGVKPWFVANIDPTTAALTPFITPATGAIEQGVIGETFNLTADCKGGAGCALRTNHNPPKATYSTTNPQVDYVPAQVTLNANDICPSVASCTENPTYPDYQYSIQCYDVNPYPCGGSVNNATWDNAVNPRGAGGPSALGAECLIHAASGQDLLQGLGTWPTVPFTFKAQSGPQNTYVVTTSSSLVTVPIIDPKTFQHDAAFGVTVIGFMQAFINQVQDGTGGTDPGDINVTVLNIAACSSTPNGANPVVGQSTSPIPVRLINSP